VILPICLYLNQSQPVNASLMLLIFSPGCSFVTEGLLQAVEVNYCHALRVIVESRQP